MYALCDSFHDHSSGNVHDMTTRIRAESDEKQIPLFLFQLKGENTHAPSPQIQLIVFLWSGL